MRHHLYKKLWIALFVIVIAVSGSYQLVHAVQDSDIYKSLQLFNQVFNMVKNKYVEDVDADKLIEGAIRGMLMDLDPHSTFLEAEDYEEMKEDHEGEFIGIGIQISVQEGVLTVISPIEGTPAYEMGVRPGDKIIKIGDESTEGITSDDAVKKLRGKKDTSVTITIRREGESKPFDLTLTRARIPIYSVPYHFMIRPEIGYVRVTRFAKNTQTELVSALDDLKQQGMKKLVLDLRNNPGGYLQQAVAMADLFLERNKLVVSTIGRLSDASETYRTQFDNQFEQLPMILVVNDGTASASEIVAGAIQDWDRGLILGKRTFGKGLVQRVYDLPPDRKKALKLTIARYYTPSGRLIQRDYEGNRDVYYDHRGQNTGDTTDVKYTIIAKRQVVGGGGILPDVMIEPDTLTTFLSDLYRKRTFFNFAIHYMAEHDSDVKAEWEVKDKVVSKFKSFLKEQSFTYDDEVFKKHLVYIKSGIKREIFNVKFNQQAGARVGIETDKQILKAVDILQGSEIVDGALKAILDRTY